MNQIALSEIAIKVKKLLALSNSDNEHEAALASIAAQKILTKYSIALSDLDILSEDIKENIVYPTCTNGKDKYTKMPTWINILSSFIARLNFCEILSGKNYLKLIGSKIDVEVSEEMINYVVKTIQKMSKNYTKTFYNSVPLGKLASISNSYCAGATDAVISNIQKLKDNNALKTSTGSDLIAVKNQAVTLFISKKYPSLNYKNLKLPNSDSVAYMFGYSEGKSLSLNSKERRERIEN